MAASALEEIQAAVDDVRMPNQNSRIFKKECMFSFDNPFTPTGIYTSLNSWQCFGDAYLARDHERTGHRLYLHQRWEKVEREEVAGGDEEAAADADAPTVLGIGVDGGFALEADKYEIVRHDAVVVMPSKQSVPLGTEGIPDAVSLCVAAIMEYDDDSTKADIAAWTEAPIQVSAYALDMVQLDTGRKISANPDDWRCDETGEKGNLWLNLHTGFIGSGRRHWDGSGGNGSALRHYEETGRQYPLVVKLGTITPKGADVYSYAPEEDDMMEDPHLGEHLAHWGINMLSMEKTEKTMVELQIEQNMKHEWDTILEKGTKLVSLSGPGYVGLQNLGNSCYMNSVIQCVVALPEFVAEYRDRADEIFDAAGPEPSDDFNVQMAKLGKALVDATSATTATGTGEDASEETYVAPAMIKALVGRGHADFGTNMQQDAAEYFQHFIEQQSRAARTAAAGASDLSKLFTFEFEHKLTDDRTGRVKYNNEAGNTLALSIPLDAIENPAEVEESNAELAAYDEKKKNNEADLGKRPDPVRPRVPFEAALARFAGDEVIGDFRSPGLEGTGTATKRTRFASFPRYLAVQLRKYVVGENWMPKKLDAEIAMPDTLDLSGLRGTGLQEGEEELPEDTPMVEVVTPDELVVAGVMSMGFSENAAKKAAINTDNAGVEQAVNWVMMHMDDADLNDPYVPPGGGATAAAGGAGGGAAAEPSPDVVAMLTPLGFEERYVVHALKQCENDADRAATWLFSHEPADIEAEIAAAAGEAAAAAGAGGDGGEADGAKWAPTYELVAFVTHMGNSTASGHYVCHVKKEGRWVVYNDRKVAESQDPPFALGYLYFYASTGQE